MSAPRPATPRALIAATLLVLAGLAFWALFVKQSGGVEQHAYNRAGQPPPYARVISGKTYDIAIRGGVDREISLGLDPSQLTCTAARPAQVPGALDLVAESKDSKATNQIASFVSAITGEVHVECKGLGTVFLENAAGAAFDWSGVWLVLACLALAAGLPLGLSALRSPAGRAGAGRAPGATTPGESAAADLDRVDPAAEEIL